MIYAYARLLNSINYPIQILIRSQTKDITSYLQLLIEQEEKSASKLQRGQIGRYRQFVSELIQERNVLDKKFYVVVPANSLEMGLLPPQTVVPGVKQVDVSTVDRSVILEKAKNILDPKRDHLIAQFARIGLYARQLQTQEIIQLFYNSYNPETSDGQQLVDSKQYTTPLVKASLMAQSEVAVAPDMFEAAPIASPEPSATSIISPSVSAPTAATPLVQAETNLNETIQPTFTPAPPTIAAPASASAITPPAAEPAIVFQNPATPTQSAGNLAPIAEIQ